MASTNNQQLFLAKPADLFCSIFLLVFYMLLLDLLVAQPEIANVFAAYPRVVMPMDPEMVWHFGVEASNLGGWIM